ncbi:MAG: PAS domain-containing protein [Candidatus Eiseniibacteriota bacterium]|nr:MAG: PAS domain-containing protein [Candidatus Eisenbacteria bacterium]
MGYGKLPQTDTELFAALLDSLKDPFLFADTGHTIRYMNSAAVSHYKEGVALIGRSLLDCHNARSSGIIKETLRALEAGEDERLISENETQLIFMRAVRGRDRRLLGYYERYQERTG